MKKAFLFTLILLLSASISFSQDTTKVNTKKDSTESKSGSTFPVFTVQDFDGNNTQTDTIFEKGKPVFVSFWQFTCKPCVKELNAIHDVIEDWEEEIEFQIVIISIDDSKTLQSAKNIINLKGWEFDAYFDINQSSKDLMGFENPPLGVILNKEGEIVWRHASYTEGDEEEIFEELKKLQ